MAKPMKAPVVREFKKPLSIDEVPVPHVGPGQILVKIAASGVCTPICTAPMATDRSSRTRPSSPATRVSARLRRWGPG